MPRIYPLPHAEWTEAARDVFGYWEGPMARENGSRSNTMMTLANHPPLALASLDLGKYFMLSSTLSARQQKMIVLRVAHRYGSPYQWAHNSLGALQVGITAEELDALTRDASDPLWSQADRALLLAIDGTGDGGKFDEQTWQMLIQVYSRQQLMDIIHATGYFTMVAWGLIAMGVELEPDFKDFSKNQAKPAD